MWPGAIEPALLLGMAYHRGNDKDKAENIFKELRDDPLWKTDPHTVRFLVAMIYLSLSDLPASSEWADTIPDESVKHSLQAELLLVQGNSGEAQERAQEALAADPDSLYGLFMLAFALYEQGRAKKAKDVCEELFERSPQHVYGLFLMGRIKIVRKKFEEAEDYFERTLQLEPNHHGALEGRGVALLIQQRCREAKEAFLAALKEHPESHRLWSYLGRVYMKLGLTGEALKAHHRAIDLNHDGISSVPDVLMGRTYLELNRIADSIKCFHDALERTPFWLGAFHDLRRALHGKESLSCHEELESLVEFLEGRLDEYEGQPQAVLAREMIARACLHLPPEEYLARGIQRATEAVERSPEDEELSLLLDELRRRNGGQAEADDDVEDAKTR
jgi:tetratricopeptide (TPR) repeat protein